MEEITTLITERDFEDLRNGEVIEMKNHKIVVKLKYLKIEDVI